MAYIFIATLGQRPQAITIALDKRMQTYPYAEICIVYTYPQPKPQGIEDALHDLRREIPAAYPGLSYHWCQIDRRDGSPLTDITSPDTGMEYLEGLTQVMLDYRKNEDTVHLLIAGGRKAMSVYATIAATSVLGGEDKVFTVLSPATVTKPDGVFRLQQLPTHAQEQVEIVEFPFKKIKARIEDLPDNATQLVQERPISDKFLTKLTDTERELALLLRDYPRATNKELAAMEYKAVKTIERHLNSIYKKLEGFLEYTVSGAAQKRRATLIDILLDRFE